MSNLFILFWYKSFKKFWSLKWSFGIYDTKPIANPMHMGIYSDYRLFVEDMKHDFCGFFSDSREFNEFSFSFWDFSFFFN